MLKNILFVLFLISIGIVNATPISSQIAFQGILSDANGNPVKDSTGYSLTFVLDTVEGAGTAIWTEVHTAVATKQGMFSVMLGSKTSLDTLKFDKQYWLGVKRDNGGLVGQKIKLGVSPYSKRALLADSSRYAAVAGSVDSKNIVGKIDSAKIADSAITSSKIKNGTILSEDASPQFKAPLAVLSDTANFIRDTSITSQKIKSIEGNKVNPQFGKQVISTDTSIQLSGEIIQNNMYFIAKETPYPGFDTIEIIFNVSTVYDGGYHEIKLGGRRQASSTTGFSPVFCYAALSWAVVDGNDYYHLSNISEHGISIGLESWQKSGTTVNVRLIVDPSYIIEGGIQISSTNKTFLRLLP